MAAVARLKGLSARRVVVSTVQALAELLAVALASAFLVAALHFPSQNSFGDGGWEGRLGLGG